MRWSVAVALVGATASGCRSDRLYDADEVFYRWNTRVTCGASIDNSQSTRPADIADALPRVFEDDSVLILYGHEPRGDAGLTVADLDGVLEAIRGAGAPYVTFRDMADTSRPRPGVSLSFDDAFVDEWYAERDTFRRYGARVTFFVTRFDLLSPDRIGKLAELESDGHEIASHGLRHRDAADYVLAHGVGAYIANEVEPALRAMRDQGFDPASFAYPYGSRASIIDHAVLEHVSIVRSTSVIANTYLPSDPCPE